MIAAGWIVAVPETLAVPLNDALVQLISPVAAIVLPVANCVADEAVPVKDAVIVPALKFPEASRATIVEAVFALVALDDTVNVWAEEPLNVAEPESPVPDVARVRLLDTCVAVPLNVAVMVPALKLPEASRATMADGVFALVAVVAEFGMLVEAVIAPVPLPYTYPVRVVAPVPPAATGKVPAVNVVAPLEYSALFAPTNVVRPVPP